MVGNVMAIARYQQLQYRGLMCNLAGMASQRSSDFPEQRWNFHPVHPEQAANLAAATGISAVMAQILLNRRLSTPDQVAAFLEPDVATLPSPLDEFPDLSLSLELLINAIHHRQPIAICGDYDADGMTSTALLLRALRYLGADVDFAIPSRMSEGYGLNQRIVEEFHGEGVQVILTVDNGIAAHQPIARARELGLTVIITDHHDLPPQLPPANAILNPKLIAAESPYYTMAGVGVAYILALTLAQALGQGQELGDRLLELFTLGTIADLAALTGVNRRWVKQGLRLLPHSQILGVQALIQVSGLAGERHLQPDAIGFRLGPRINAVGRIGDPQIVIEMLTTDDEGMALERAMQCEQINKQRQQLCAQITAEAIELYETSTMDAQASRVLVLLKAGWHHGVIGIVASRLVERYGVPVFISTYEDEAQTHIRGSARGIPEFHVFEALEFAKDLLLKHGGHRAAGGFSLMAENLAAFRQRLSDFAHTCLEPQHLKPLVTIDAKLALSDITLDLYHQMDALHPCGMGNPDPVFWTPQVRLLDQKRVGKNHLRLSVAPDALNADQPRRCLSAIAWNWGDYHPLPEWVDLAYRLRTNEWQGEVELQLEILGVRLPGAVTNQVEFVWGDRTYTCHVMEQNGKPTLSIRNRRGDVLSVIKGQSIGTMHRLLQPRQSVDVTQAPYFDLIRAAAHAWGKVT
jgi:single-stranded-DNA-specific exonuclease